MEKNTNILLLECFMRGETSPDEEQILSDWLHSQEAKSSYPTIIRKPGKALITSSLPKYNVRYLKLRNLEFGYTFPKEWLQNAELTV